MRFHETPITGALVIEPEKLADERGFFARLYCRKEFIEHGLDPELVQISLSQNLRQGTLRGLHYQRPPYEEVKLVRCLKGRIFDVVADLRPESPSYRKAAWFELSDENRLALYIPKGCAHGFQTLTDQAEVLYQMSEFYHPESSTGIVYNDPALKIPWPLPDPILSERDRNWPPLG